MIAIYGSFNSKTQGQLSDEDLKKFIQSVAREELKQIETRLTALEKIVGTPSHPTFTLEDAKALVQLIVSKIGTDGKNLTKSELQQAKQQINDFAKDDQEKIARLYTNFDGYYIINKKGIKVLTPSEIKTMLSLKK